MNTNLFPFDEKKIAKQESVIAFDIETIPNEAMIPILPEPEVKLGNLKGTSKIEEKRKEAKQKQIEKLGINPETGMVCSFAVYGVDENNKEISFCHAIDNVSYSEEIRILNILFDVLNKGITEEIQLVVTHNGIDFDFPYIYKRAMINSIELPEFMPSLTYWTRKYNYEKHIDLLQVWRNWSSHSQGPANLDYLGKILLGDGKTKRDYSEYLDLVKNGESEKIAIDNLCDVKITYELYRKFKGYLFQ